MVGRLLIIGALGLAGVVGPFLIVRVILEDLFFPVSVTGDGTPLVSAIAGFGAASLIALLAIYLSARAMFSMKQKPESGDEEEATEEVTEEELPE